MITHYLLLKIKEEYLSEKEELLGLAKELFGKIPDDLVGIKDLSVQANCIERDSNMDILVKFRFEDRKILDEYLKHPLHLKFIELTRMKTSKAITIDV